MARAARSRQRPIVAGVDTHGDFHHAAVMLMNGARIGDAQFPADSAGYAALLAWLTSFGRLHAAGVEGTGSYGAGLARYLTRQGVRVVEVNRPDRQQRRMAGKSDPLDAYAAADAVVAGRARAVAKGGDGIVESIRALHITRAGAVKARTAAVNELRALLVTAPAPLREQLAPCTTVAALTRACAALRPAGDHACPATATRTALRSLARRIQALTTEITALDDLLDDLVTRACPALPAITGIGTHTGAQLLITCGDNPHRITSEASFAALCGVSPIPASSGKTSRHRLSRGGDRRANKALYTIAITRLAHSPRTRHYMTTRTARGKTKPEIIRCLKRYIAREVYRAITTPQPALDT